MVGKYDKANTAKRVGLAQKASQTAILGLFVSLVWLPCSLVPTPVRADNLAQMLYDVYDNNPDIRAAEAAHDAKRATTREAEAALLPKVNLNASHSLTEERLKGGRGYAHKRTSQYGVSANQRLFNGFQTRNTVLKSKYEARSSEFQARNPRATDPA